MSIQCFRTSLACFSKVFKSPPQPLPRISSSVLATENTFLHPCSHYDEQIADSSWFLKVQAMVPLSHVLGQSIIMAGVYDEELYPTAGRGRGPDWRPAIECLSEAHPPAGSYFPRCHGLKVGPAAGDQESDMVGTFYSQAIVRGSQPCSSQRGGAAMRKHEGQCRTWGLQHLCAPVSTCSQRCASSHGPTGT